MWKKYSAFYLISIVVVVSIAACGGAEKDPYALVTLRQATQGKVVSKGFKYRFQNPQIVQLKDHLGLIREGNLLEFIGGRSLESKLQAISGDFELCVVKEYSPFVHFKVEKIYTTTDTTFIAATGTINYPQIRNAAEFEMEKYTEVSVDYFPFNRTAFLKDQVGKDFFVSCRVAMEEEEEEQFFVLCGENTKLRVSPPSDGITIMLKTLMDGNLTFEGGFTFMEMEESFPYRKRTGIVGVVDIKFVKYGTTIVSI